jgi:hypothetical protein
MPDNDLCKDEILASDNVAQSVDKTLKEGNAHASVSA